MDDLKRGRIKDEIIDLTPLDQKISPLMGNAGTGNTSCGLTDIRTHGKPGGGI